MRKPLLTVLALLVVALLMFPATGLSQPKYGGSLVFGVESDIKQIDPHKALTSIEFRNSSLMCEDLVGSAQDFSPAPGLAKSWEISPDGLEWTFYLRKGVKFHNGRELTAEDIKFNMDRILDEKTASGMKSRLGYVDSAEVLDRYTVKLILKNPSGALLSALWATPMIAPECVNEDGSVTHPIGTGPFEFVEWKTNEYLKYKKFKDYWIEGLPYLDEVIIKPVPDETVRMTALRTGDLDITYYLPLDQAAEFVKDKPEDFQVTMYALGFTEFIHFNLSKPPFDDVRVRQAVAYGLNKEDMLLGVYQGFGEAVNQAFSRKSRWYCDVPDFVRDVNKAKALLAEAGYPDGLEVTLATTNQYPAWPRAAEIVQEQLKDIGLKIKLEISDWPTFAKKAVAGEYTIAYAAWAPIADPDLVYPGAYIPGGTYGFLTGNAYDNPQVTTLLEQARAAVDFNERKALYTEAGKILFQQDLPWIWTLSAANAQGWRSDVKGYVPHIDAYFAYIGGGLQYTWLDR